ncbi:MAG: hypothetical protein KGL48_15820 [Sphingomonadales bacterium]|nr:hypothetical protein [Sphingomonadales bacterium]MDE2569068.1 hypothetical protein [Sphingomonadales bacterium]
MSLFDQLLGQVAGNVDIQNLAAKVGIDPGQAESAIAALAAAHPAEGDTVQTAAANTGIEAGVLQQIVGHIGGEGSLGQFASMLGEHPEALSMATSLLGKESGGLGGLLGAAKGLLG